MMSGSLSQTYLHMLKLHKLASHGDSEIFTSTICPDLDRQPRSSVPFEKAPNALAAKAAGAAFLD